MDEKHNDIDEGNQEQWELFEVRNEKVFFYEEEVLPIAPLPILSLKDLHGEQLRTIAKGIAMIVLEAFWSINWEYYENLCEIDPKVLHSARRMVFKSLTNFVLNIFNIEDFQRIVEHQMITKNCREFYQALCEGFNSRTKPAISAMEAMSKGWMNTKGFPFLWDRDVNYILGVYQYKCEGSKATYDFDLAFGATPEYPLAQYFVVYDHYVRIILDAIQEHVPSEGLEEHKLDLMMGNISRVDAWRDINFEELEKFGPDEFDCLVSAIQNAIDHLASLKAELLDKSNRWATFPLTCGVFGGVTKEVLEVVRIANLERIQLGQRFLSTDNILSGFSRSIIADTVNKFIKEWQKTPIFKNLEETNPIYYICKEWQNPIFKNLEETNPIYYICKASGDVARVLGYDTIELEHLFLATVFGNRQGIDEN